MRSDYLNKLYNKKLTAQEFAFENLVSPVPLFMLIPPLIVDNLRKIAMSKKRIKQKTEEMTEILKYFGFRKYLAGTNRVIFAHYEYPTILIKVAIDSVGMKDSPKEFYNQNLLKPFCTKIFEVSPCGTVAVVERFTPILSLEEFKYSSDDIFNIIYNKILGKYILDDFGTDYFMNWGIRDGFGPGILDFPYVFNIDGNKLYCMKPLVEGQALPVCGGEIDYDEGFNNLICTKCGKVYTAEDLGMEKSYLSDGKKTPKIYIQGGKKIMKVTLMKGNKIEAQSEKSFEILPEVIPSIDDGEIAQVPGDKLKVSLFKGEDEVASSERSSEYEKIVSLKRNAMKKHDKKAKTFIVRLDDRDVFPNRVMSEEEKNEVLEYTDTITDEDRFVESTEPASVVEHEVVLTPEELNQTEVSDKAKSRKKFENKKKKKDRKYINNYDNFDLEDY